MFGLESAQPRRTAKSKNNLFFDRLAPAAPSAFFAVLHPRYFQHRFGQKKNLLKTPGIRFLCVFLMFSMRFFWVSGHLPSQSENRVAQILLLCSVVFVVHAVIPVEGSLPPENNAVSFLFWQLISVAATVLAPVQICLSSFCPGWNYYYYLQFSRCVRSVQRQ